MSLSTDIADLHRFTQDTRICRGIAEDYQKLEVVDGGSGGNATLSAAFEEGAVDVDSLRAFVGGEREFGGLSDERVHGG